MHVWVSSVSFLQNSVVETFSAGYAELEPISTSASYQKWRLLFIVTKSVSPFTKFLGNPYTCWNLRSTESNVCKCAWLSKEKKNSAYNPHRKQVYSLLFTFFFFPYQGNVGATSGGPQGLVLAHPGILPGSFWRTKCRFRKQAVVSCIQKSALYHVLSLWPPYLTSYNLRIAVERSLVSGAETVQRTWLPPCSVRVPRGTVTNHWWLLPSEQLSFKQCLK